MSEPDDTAGLVIGVNVCGKHFANCRLCETACTANAERIETLLRQQADSDKRIAELEAALSEILGLVSDALDDERIGAIVALDAISDIADAALNDTAHEERNSG